MKKKSRSQRAKEADAKPQPTVLSQKDKMTLMAFIGALILIPALFGVIAGWNRRQSRLEHRLAEWRTEYHLNDDQLGRIRAIEADFHGTNNWFFSEEQTAEQVMKHDEEISLTMNREDGERFLRAVMHKKEK